MSHYFQGKHIYESTNNWGDLTLNLKIISFRTALRIKTKHLKDNRVERQF